MVLGITACGVRACTVCRLVLHPVTFLHGRSAAVPRLKSNDLVRPRNLDVMRLGTKPEWSAGKPTTDGLDHVNIKQRMFLHKFVTLCCCHAATRGVYVIGERWRMPS